MISSKVLEALVPLFDIIGRCKGKTIREIKSELFIGDKCKMKKGASGLIVENILGIKNNSRPEADLPQIGCEVKILPLQCNKNGEIKAKEPTAIQMINLKPCSFGVAKGYAISSRFKCTTSISIEIDLEGPFSTW